MTSDAPTGLPGAGTGFREGTTELATVPTGIAARAAASWRQAGGWLIPRLSWNRAALGLFAVLVTIVIATFADYGVTWDEDVHNWYGVFVFDYYLTFFRDLRSVEWGDVNNYGAAFDMTAAALNHLSPFGVYETRHLLNGIVGVVGIIGAWK